MDQARSELFEAFIKNSMDSYGVDAARVKIDRERDLIVLQDIKSQWDQAIKWTGIVKASMPSAIEEAVFSVVDGYEIIIIISDSEALASQIKISRAPQMPDSIFTKELEM